MKVNDFFRNALLSAFKEKTVEVRANDIKVRFTPEGEEQSIDTCSEPKEKTDIIYAIGEAEVALAVPFGILAFLL